MNFQGETTLILFLATSDLNAHTHLMEALRAQSRTPQGRLEIVLHLDQFLSGLSLRDADGVAVLANLFSDDGSCKLLLATTGESDILRQLVNQLSAVIDSNPALFLSTSVCLGNAWSQTLRHRQALRELGLPRVMVGLLSNSKFGSLVRRGMVNMHSLEQTGDFTAFTTQEMDMLLGLGDDGSLGELLLSSLSFVKSAGASHQQRIKMQHLLTQEQPSLLLLGEAIAEFPSHELFELVFESGEVMHSLAEHPELLVQLLGGNTEDGRILDQVIAQQIPHRLVQLVADTSRRIPFQESQRVVDQQQVLPFATTRLHCLNALSFLVAKGERYAKQLVGELSAPMAKLCLEYCSYDYEATRAGALVLKHTSLANPACFLREVPHLTALVATLIKSQDHHTSFIFCGIFRTVCAHASCDPGSFTLITSSKDALLDVLSVDLTRLHPHARVELARAVSSLMRASSPNKQVLETVQAVKFASFLLASQSPELHLECLAGMANLPCGVLAALPRFEIEIVPNMPLVGRICEIGATTADAQVAKTCQQLAFGQ
ncbi:hypothetical protein BASA81_010147 [Batrachochytrium salamandrivorans]|nr:hypothetical protein BASA81_010147 [Batrachochytrium salamandrivorans]